jgi:hypothetical protein
MNGIATGRQKVLRESDKSHRGVGLTSPRAGSYYRVMSKPLIIEEGPMTPEFARAWESARRNRMWFNDHVIELEVYKHYRGKYVASAAGELFVADTPEEIHRLLREKYPDEVAHVRYIQREKLERIYACQW